jgi:hypothetical protein
MMKRNLFDLARLLFVLASAMAFPAAAGEVFNSETHRRDVTIERYSPTATVVSVLVTNGGSYAATGTHSYAVAAAGFDWRVTSVASNVTVATGGLVRIQWKPLGGATNYYLAAQRHELHRRRGGHPGFRLRDERMDHRAV